MKYFAFQEVVLPKRERESSGQQNDLRCKGL